jgi:hypothetical protein
MLRALLAMTAAACGAASGSATTARPAAPLSNASSAVAASPCELGWLEHAESLIVTESSNGHFGFFELHAELRARGRELAGAVRATYKDYPDRPLRPATLELRAPRARVAAVLAAVARGAVTPDRPTHRRRVLVTDSSQSMTIAVEVAATIRGVAHHARLETEGGHIQPQPWSIRGCERELSHDARALVSQQYARLELLVRRHDILELLQSRARP